MPRPFRTLTTTAIGLAVGLAGVAAPPAQASVAAPRVVGATSTPVTASATTALNVRTGPATSYPAVARLRAGQTVTGTVANGWMRITAGALTGRYVSATYLTVVRPTPPGTVTAWMTSEHQHANIRSGPGFGFPVVGRTAIHQRVTGTVVGDWLKIAPNRFVNRGTMSPTSTPSALNGRLPLTSLCTIPQAYNARHDFAPGYTPTTQRRLNCFALHALDGLEAAYKAHFGTYAEIDMAYRTYAEQAWWYRQLGPAAALPAGRSNHGQGQAVDFREDPAPNTFFWGRPGFMWLKQNAGRFGYDNPFRWGTAHESYHFDFLG